MDKKLYKKAPQQKDGEEVDVDMIKAYCHLIIRKVMNEIEKVVFFVWRKK